MALIKLPTQNQMTQYVERKIDSIIKEHDQEVQLTYYLRKEYTDEEYTEMLKDIDERIVNPPEDKIKPSDDMLVDASVQKKIELEQLLRETYISSCLHERQLIERDMKRAKDFKQFLSKRTKELNNYPKNTDDLIRQLQEYITRTVNYYHKDLVDSYFDMFVDKVSKMCPDDKDYSNTIASVYRSKNSKKAMDILTKFFDAMKKQLTTISMNVRRCGSVEYYKMFELIKVEFKKLIERMHGHIYDFIKRQIGYISDEEEMTDSRAVKIYSETCMAQMNQALVSELPPLLDEQFTIAVEDRVENLQYVWKQQIGYDFSSPKAITQTQPQPTELHEERPSFTSFLETIPSDEIEVNDLTRMYNNYFGSNKNSNGFSKLKDVKGAFSKRIEKRNGKQITYYSKL